VRLCFVYKGGRGNGDQNKARGKEGPITPPPNLAYMCVVSGGLRSVAKGGGRGEAEIKKKKKGVGEKNKRQSLAKGTRTKGITRAAASRGGRKERVRKMCKRPLKFNFGKMNRQFFG